MKINYLNLPEGLGELNLKAISLYGNQLTSLPKSLKNLNIPIELSNNLLPISNLWRDQDQLILKGNSSVEITNREGLAKPEAFRLCRVRIQKRACSKT